MTELPKYHTPEQGASVLLGPIQAALSEIEGRVEHYLERIRLAEGDEGRLRAAHRALATARAEIERLRVEGAAPEGEG